MKRAIQRRLERENQKKEQRFKQPRPSRFTPQQQQQMLDERKAPVVPVLADEVVTTLDSRPLTRPLPKRLTDTTDESRCLIAVDKGSIKVDFERPHRSVNVTSPNAIELPIDKPHRVTVLEEGTSWRHIFTQHKSSKDTIWLIKRG